MLDELDPRTRHLYHRSRATGCRFVAVSHLPHSNERFLRHFRRALLVWPLKGYLQDSFGFASAARATYFGHVFVARPLSSVVRRSAAAGLFLLRAMVAIAVVSRHPPPHFVESGAALLLSARISTRERRSSPDRCCKSAL